MTNEKGYMQKAAEAVKDNKSNKEKTEILLEGLNFYNDKICELLNSFPSIDKLLVLMSLEAGVEVIKGDFDGMDKIMYAMLTAEFGARGEIITVPNIRREDMEEEAK